MTDSKTATELLDGLRDVGNLHEFAELFGFDWYDESDWTWHDVAVKMADDFEQAIAATLVSGRLTAEQVRDFLNRHSVFNDTTWLHGRQELVFDGNELQAMADELNATLGTEYHGYEQAAIEAWESIKAWNQRHVETCCITASATDGLCTDRPRQYFELSCGHSFTLDGLEAPNYCPNCGKAVKR